MWTPLTWSPISSPGYYIQFEMVNLMCQPAWVTGGPGVWLNVVSEYVCEGVPRKGQHWNREAVKQLPLSTRVGVGQATEDCIEQKVQEGGSPSLCLILVGHQSVFSCLWTKTSTVCTPDSKVLFGLQFTPCNWNVQLSSFQAFRLRLQLVPFVLVLCRTSDLDWNCTTNFPGSPGCRWQIVDFLATTIV